MQQQAQTREQLFEQELQKRITPLLREMPYTGALFTCVPGISTNQVLEQYSAMGLKGVGKADYTDLVEGKLTYHNVRFLWELVAGITPQQLNVDPQSYLKIIAESQDNLDIHKKVLSKEVLDKFKVEIDQHFALMQKKFLDQQNPGSSVIPNNKR